MSQLTPVASLAIIQVLSIFISVQNMQIFKLALLKIKPICKSFKPIWKIYKQKGTLYKQCPSSNWSVIGKNQKFDSPFAQCLQPTRPRLRGLRPKRVRMTKIYKLRSPLRLKISSSNLLVSLKRKLWKFSRTNLSLSTSNSSGICKVSLLRLIKTRKRLRLRMVCWSCKRHLGHTRTIAASFKRSDQKPSSITAQLWSPYLRQWFPSSRLLSPNFMTLSYNF